MLTIQPHDSLAHMSNQIGQLMQKYRIFQNLLGLRACEIKKMADLESNQQVLKLKIDRQQSMTNDVNVKEQLVGDILNDGDEFVFKLTSFDRWIKWIVNFQLKGFNGIKFTKALEMRVVGYFPNSHFFNLLQKYIINFWNQEIKKYRQGGLYILKDISFINRKTVVARVDKNKENGKF